MEFCRGMEFWRYGILVGGLFGILVRGLFWIFVAFWYGILLFRFSLVFCVFRGRCLWIFFWLVVHAGMEFGCFVLVLYQDFFRTCFSGFFPGLSSCGLFATRFQFLGPHGPGFFHRPSIWNFGPPKPELTLEPWRQLAFTATPTSMAAWLPVEDAGRLSRCCSR